MRDFTDAAYGIDIDAPRVAQGAASGLAGLAIGAGEYLPYRDGAFDGVLLNEVIEHVHDDREALREALRVTRVGGRVFVFAPNRFYPFETHGVYLGKRYIFGNIALVNYLPDALRGRLVPHARAYTKGGLQAITRGLPARWLEWTVVYPGFDNIVARSRPLGAAVRRIAYGLEQTPLRRLGLSHFLVLERTAA